jgi:uncharacterized protein (DUF433 family)
MLPLNDQPIPIRIDEHGVARVGGTRIPLETIVGAFRRGASPEEIVHAYSALKLSDVYKVISFIIDHPGEIAEYMKDVDIDRAASLELIKEHGDLYYLRDKLLALQREGS